MKPVRKIAIVGGGRVSKQFLPEILKNDYIIGVDRGAYWLIINKIVPNTAIGDFDSVSAREFQTIKNKVKRVEEHPKEKDATDMEIAVGCAILLKPQYVTIYGAVGTRLDHFLAAMQLLEKLLKAGICASIHDEYNDVFLVDKEITLSKDSRKPYLSLLPITKRAAVTITGCAYNAACLTLHRGKTLGVSNEIREDQAMITMHHGMVLVTRSRD